jgi:hypothetical protein
VQHEGHGTRRTTATAVLFAILIATTYTPALLIAGPINSGTNEIQCDRIAAMVRLG